MLREYFIFHLSPYICKLSYFERSSRCWHLQSVLRKKALKPSCLYGDDFCTNRMISLYWVVPSFPQIVFFSTSLAILDSKFRDIFLDIFCDFELHFKTLNCSPKTQNCTNSLYHPSTLTWHRSLTLRVLMWSKEIIEIMIRNTVRCNLCNIVISTAPADGLAPSGARTSAVAVMTKDGSH